jgi:hypothetical protein
MPVKVIASGMRKCSMSIREAASSAEPRKR